MIGDTHCPDLEDIANSSMVHMCPSYHVMEYDENRIPSVLEQVFTDTFNFQERQPFQNCICLPSVKGSTLKYFLPMGANVFILG